MPRRERKPPKRKQALARTAEPDGLTIEDCLDEFNDFVQTLDRFKPQTIARALCVHLGILLGAMVECELYTHDDAKDLLREVEQSIKETGA